MNSRIINITLVALTLGLSCLAQAQSPPEQGIERSNPRIHDQGYRGDHADYNREEGRVGQGRRLDHRHGDYYRHPDEESVNRDRNWRRGDRMPLQYRRYQYVVEDWRGHRLYAPRRGQYWVQNGGDYLLVAIATGVIVAIVSSQ